MGEVALVRVVVAFILVFAAMMMPFATAQGPLPGPNPVLTIHPLMAPIAGDAATRLTVRLDIPCGPGASPGDIRVTYQVLRLPAWASATLSRAEDEVGIGQCVNERVSLVNEIFLTITHAAPAFQPDVVELMATLTQPLHDARSAKSAVPITADFIPGLHAQLKREQLSILPGQAGVIPVAIHNFGNAHTKISFTATTTNPAIQVAAPPPVTLQSRQTGGSLLDAEIPVAVYALPKAVFLGPVTVTLQNTSAYALDSKIVGDSGSVQFVVVPGTSKESSAPVRQVPDLAAPLAGLGVSMAAMMARKR